MTPIDFCMWLKGYSEVSESLTPSDHEWRIIQNKLDEVLKEVKPQPPSILFRNPLDVIGPGLPQREVTTPKWDPSQPYKLNEVTCKAPE